MPPSVHPGLPNQASRLELWPQVQGVGNVHIRLTGVVGLVEPEEVSVVLAAQLWDFADKILRPCGRQREQAEAAVRQGIGGA